MTETIHVEAPEPLQTDQFHYTARPEHLVKEIHAVTHCEPFAPWAKTQRFCGPGALSAITGRTAECGAAWINVERGRPAWRLVQGCSNHQVRRALRKLGYIARRQYVCNVITRSGRFLKPTVMQWLDQRIHKSATYLVVVTGHYVVVRGNQLVDNQHGNPVHVERSKHIRKRVRMVFIIERGLYNDDRTARRKRSDPLPKGHRAPKRCWPKTKKVDRQVSVEAASAGPHTEGRSPEEKT